VLRRVRILSQAVCFLAFLYLLARTQYSGADQISLPVKLLLELDPLAFLATWLSSGAVQGLMWLALITVGLTLLFGRFFCGWVCPLGTMIQLAEKLPLRKRRSVLATNRWHRSQVIKFYFLAVLLAAALAGVQLAGIFDPLSIAIRSMAFVVLPAIEWALRPLFEAAYHHDPLGITAVSEPLYDSLQGTLMSFRQPYFHQVALFAAVFFGILGLSFVRYRFWCRILCPLGALLGVIARFGFLRLHQPAGCTACHLCTFDCQGAAEPEIRDGWRPSECVVCGNCTRACKRAALRFGFARPSLRVLLPPGEREGLPAAATYAGTQVRRRHFMLAVAGGLITAPVLRLGEKQVRPDPRLIRPPGARPEQEFLELCIRCGECMKVCLTNGLQPTLLEAGLEGLWSPRLVPRIGYCEYNCTLCGQVCPTQAIRSLMPEEKRRVRIGLATFDKGRCLPYAFQTTCLVCEEHCPTPKKAIWFEEVEVLRQDGERRIVKQPHVSPELCIGCGICETKCPVQDLPAIRVTSANEDRNPGNRVLLEPERHGISAY
jgi:polyferredoxin